MRRRVSRSGRRWRRTPIKGQRNHGSDDQTIFDSLKYQGYTDDEIWKAFELAG